MTVRKDLGIIFLISLVFVIMIDLWLINIPEKFERGYELGQFFYKLGMSYISAFIFYFLVIHIKQQKDKENLYSYVSKKVYMIIGSATGLISELAKCSKTQLSSKYPSSLELSLISERINPNTKAPLLDHLGNYSNWIQYFDYSKQESNEATEKIFKKIAFLDAELVNLIANIEDCSHFIVIKSIVGSKNIENQNIKFIESSLSDYFELIKKLELYADKELSQYIE